MADPAVFAARTPEDYTNLVAQYPLAWVVSGEGSAFRASLLPLRPVIDVNGEIQSLVGHFARANDHYTLLKDDGAAHILFLGPNGYISPSWMNDRSQAATWNYASAQFAVDIEFSESPEDLANHLNDLVTTMEQGRPQAWSIAAMGSRYADLAKHIVVFRATVKSYRGKFKLGQDERADVYADIIGALTTGNSSPLLQWMQDFNKDR